MKPGDRVTYIPDHLLLSPDKWENGIVKEIHPDNNKAWVVFHCAGDWERYYKYTGALTDFTNLRNGWLATSPSDLYTKN